MGGGRNGLAAQQELIVKTHMVIVLHTPCSQASPTNYAPAGYCCGEGYCIIMSHTQCVRVGTWLRIGVGMGRIGLGCIGRI